MSLAQEYRFKVLQITSFNLVAISQSFESNRMKKVTNQDIFKYKCGSMRESGVSQAERSQREASHGVI